MNWWFVIAVTAIVATILTVYLVKHNDDMDIDLNIWGSLGTMVLWAFTIIATLYFICVQVDYKALVGKYKLQKELYSTVSVEDNFVATSNIIEVNNELFEMQASKNQFGEWSMVPREVLDLEPIGIK